MGLLKGKAIRRNPMRVALPREWKAPRVLYMEGLRLYNAPCRIPTEPRYVSEIFLAAIAEGLGANAILGMETEAVTQLHASLIELMNADFPDRYSVLGYARYAIIHARDRGALRDMRAKIYLAERMVDIARKIGRPEGVVVVKEVLTRYGCYPTVKRAVAAALASIGFIEDLKTICDLRRSDQQGVETYTGAIDEFLQRYPECQKDFETMTKKY